MISVQDGRVKFKGSRADLLSEVGTLIHALGEEKVATKEDFKWLVDIAFKTPEELRSEVMKQLDETLEKFRKLMEK